MLFVPTLREILTAHVTLDTMEMDLPATVRMLLTLHFELYILLQILMSVVMEN